VLAASNFPTPLFPIYAHRTRPPVLLVPASIRRTWAATTLASASGWMFMGWILGLSPSFLHEQLGIQISQPIVAGLAASPAGDEIKSIQAWYRNASSSLERFNWSVWRRTGTSACRRCHRS
jgi:hypothetical protein